MTDERFLPAFAKVARQYGFKVDPNGAIRGRDDQCPITAVFQATRRAGQPVATMFAYFAGAKLGLSAAFTLRVTTAADGEAGPLRTRLIDAMRGVA